MLNLLLLFCIFSFSCGKESKDPEPLTVDVTPLITKKVAYEQFAAQHTEKYKGWVNPKDCDSLLFTGLYTAAGGYADLSAARDAAGKFYRRPLDYDNCYPNESASEISRDMFIGLLWGIWETRNLDLAEAIVEYGEANDWIMGEGDPTRTIFTPALVSTLYRLVYKLGGKRKSSLENYPISISKVSGFEAHLLVLHMLLRSYIEGKALIDYVDAFEYQANREPENALFQAAYHRYAGDQTKAFELLMDERHWPIDRLPDGREHCEPWLWQRDSGKDWEPCDAKEHSGGDWLFATKIILDN